MSYSNSPLVTYTKLSPNRTSPRNHKIDTITIHCYAAQVTASRGCSISRFVTYSPKSGASCNYVVGYDGSIGLCVEEKNRSWCTSSRTNDNRAVTIEVASDNFHPYAVTDKAYEALIKLVADICKRNNIDRLVWSTSKNTRMNHLNGANMTVHRDYANKACPGDYLYNRMGDIANKVNALINGEEELNMTKQEFIESLTEDEAIQILNKARKSMQKPVTITDQDYRKEGLEFVKDAGIMVGDGTGNQMPNDMLTRGQAAVMLMRLCEYLTKKLGGRLI